MSDLAQLGPTTVVLARCTLPMGTGLVSAICRAYAEECRRVGYSEPEIVFAGPLYEPGYLTIVATRPAGD